MKNTLSPHDLKNLSAYLDGELNAFSSRKMKNRLARDPNLRTALDTLRETKSILQRTPKRRVPHNFNVSPQMVAISPPMPRLVPALNYATALAMILFFFSILPPFGIGSGAVLPPAQDVMMEPAAMAETYAMEEAESAPVMEGDDAGLPAENNTESERTFESEKAVASTPFATSTSSATLAATPNIDEIQESVLAPSFTHWQEILLGLIILFAIAGFVLRRNAITKWEKEK